MSATIETIVACDRCGDNMGGDDRNMSAKEIRKARKAEGWKQAGPKDYCPRCVKEMMDEHNLKVETLNEKSQWVVEEEKC